MNNGWNSVFSFLINILRCCYWISLYVNGHKRESISTLHPPFFEKISLKKKPPDGAGPDENIVSGFEFNDSIKKPNHFPFLG